MGVLCAIFLICSLRTNIVLVIIMLTLSVAFPVLAGADWHLGQRNIQQAKDLQQVS
jgi:hypothetical protein